jgi:DHA1 family bicyclomycin/chloramphenicol resistance-like MFS transporter
MFFGPLSDSVGRKPAIYTGLVLFISGCLLSILATSFPVMLAPGVGQVILMIAYWRAIFGLLLAVAAIALVWFGLRQPETLAPERRVSFSPSRIVLAVRETCVHRAAATSSANRLGSLRDAIAPGSWGGQCEPTVRT